MNRSIAILYGSETGNAHDYAETLATTLERFRFKVEVSSLDDFNLKKLVQIQILVVLCSTTGQGEFPKNSRKFWKFMLKKKLPRDLLNHIVFTTFGLGDSSYPRFNWAIKKLHNRLLQLGAVELSKRAEADEQSSQGIDGFYVEWQNLLIKTLNEQLPLPQGLEPISEDTLLPPKNKLVIDMKKPKRLTNDKLKSIALTRDDQTLIHAKISTNRRITTEDHFQDVRHFSFSTEASLSYDPGDTVSLFPTNSPHDVQRLIDCQQWQDVADKRVHIEGELPQIEGGYVKNPTLRSLLTHHLDLKAIPRRSFFGLLKHFANDDRERGKLAEFASFADPEELYNYCNRPRRSILEIIEEFFSVKIPLDYLFDLLPIIKPRLFSISSGPNPNSVDLTVAVVQYKTMLRRIRKGLCTSWLKTLEAGDEIVFKLNKNNTKFPLKRAPIIMIAPGTGVAPMRSLINDRVAKGFNSNELYLFFGNRFHNKDFLYSEEWRKLTEQKRLTLYTSFSREQEGYVQDKLYLEAPLIIELLTHKDAVIFVCGSSGKMPNQVRLTLETILQEQRQLTVDQSKQYLLELENSGRYIQETW